MSTKGVHLSISEVCPNCIEPLVFQKRKIGNFKNWFVCPICGYRERPAASAFTKAAEGAFIDRIRRNNNKNVN